MLVAATRLAPWGWLLATDVIGGPVVPVVGLVVLALVVALAVRRWPLRRAIVTGVATLGAGAVGVAIAVSASLGDWFDAVLGPGTILWSWLTFALIGFAGTSLVLGPRWWRRALAAMLLPAALVLGVLQVNADFGVNRTLGDLVGVSPYAVVSVPEVVRPSASASTSSAGDDPSTLWSSWRAPADMPKTGKEEQVVIPPTRSGFSSRPAGLYLPPAALVADPPKLPFVLMMMGQPGTPDPRYAAEALDALAAAHHGLAPIVLVVDQLGNPADDTLCIDSSKYGRVQTFVTVDAVNWARSHLNIDQDPRYWTVAGYSDGGACALEYGSALPQLFKNVLSVSGEIYPGASQSAKNLAAMFGGKAAAYQAIWPANILPKHHYPDTMGVFTVGAADSRYGPGQVAAVAMTEKAGWSSQLIRIAGAGHVGDALSGGLAQGFAALYVRLGLAP